MATLSRLERFATDVCLLATSEREVRQWAAQLDTMGYEWAPPELMQAANSTTSKGPRVIEDVAQVSSLLSMGLALFRAPTEIDDDDDGEDPDKTSSDD
jgi:hypothetical protein